MVGRCRERTVRFLARGHEDDQGVGTQHSFETRKDCEEGGERFGHKGKSQKGAE